MTRSTGTEDSTATAVVYLRVSSSGQVNKGTDPEGYSIPGQREATRLRAGQLSATVLKEYVEYGVSGRTTDRPALQQMLAELVSLRPTYVIIYDLSRLARNRLDDATLMLEIVQSGAALVSVLENIDQTPAGKLTHGVLAAVNEFRSDGDAEKVKMGLRRKHAMGGTIGKAPIGYLNVRKRVLGRDVRGVEIDPDRADLVRMAFACYASGEYTLTGITELLEASGLKTPMTAKRPPAPLARSAVHRMLKDEYYIGVVTYKGVRNPEGLHPALIDRQTFDRVQEVLRGHALSGDRSQKHSHYLKGTLYCGHCGSRLLYNPVTGNGGRYVYFSCQGRMRRGVDCRARHLPVDEVEAAVENYYQRHVALDIVDQQRIRDSVARYAERKLRTAKRESERAERRVEALKQEQQRLLQLSYRDLVDEDVLAAEQARIKHERAQADKWIRSANLDAHEITRAVDEALSLLDRPGPAYALATSMARRMFNQSLFDALLVSDGEIVAARRKPWNEAIHRLRDSLEAEEARRRQPPRQARARGSDRQGTRNDHDPRNGGRGLNFDQMVRRRGLEPPRGYPPQGPQPCASTNSATGAGGPRSIGRPRSWRARGCPPRRRMGLDA